MGSCGYGMGLLRAADPLQLGRLQKACGIHQLGAAEFLWRCLPRSFSQRVSPYWACIRWCKTAGRARIKLNGQSLRVQSRIISLYNYVINIFSLARMPNKGPFFTASLLSVSLFTALCFEIILDSNDWKYKLHDIWRIVFLIVCKQEMRTEVPTGSFWHIETAVWIQPANF